MKPVLSHHASNAIELRALLWIPSRPRPKSNVMASNATHSDSLHLQILCLYMDTTLASCLDQKSLRLLAWRLLFLDVKSQRRAVNLAYRDENGALHFWDNQLKIIEQHVLTEALASPPWTYLSTCVHHWIIERVSLSFDDIWPPILTPVFFVIYSDDGKLQCALVRLS